MTSMPKAPTDEQTYYQYLMQYRAGHTNEPMLAQMLASSLCAKGDMPLYLGLPLDSFRQVMAYYFPNLIALFLRTLERAADIRLASLPLITNTFLNLPPRVDGV